MKMGLSMVLVGHINFLLAALVHGVVLRHINLQKDTWTLEYTVSSGVALTSGLVGIIVGILTIVLAKNKKSKGLTWSLFVFSLTAAVMAAVSAIGLCVSVVLAIVHGGQSLLSRCHFPDASGYSSVANECPFDPTRIYSTTLILWLPLIVTSVVQLVFSSRCFAVCFSFLGLPCCPPKKRPRSHTGSISVVKPLEVEPFPYTAAPTNTKLTSNNPQPQRCTHKTPTRPSAPLVQYTECPTHYSSTRSHSSEPIRTHQSTPRNNSEVSRQPPPPPLQYVPRRHRSLPPSQRQPLNKPQRERSHQEKTRTGTQQRAPEQHRLLDRGPLERGPLERSSFWI